MRILRRLLWSFFLGCVGVQLAYALPVTITDPYGGQSNPGSSNGDVIGALGGFDIESLTFTQLGASGVTAGIRFNYNFGDAILAPYVMSVVNDPMRVLAEMGRVCRPGGRIVIVNH